MSTREQFLPSKWITNPKHLPSGIFDNTYINAKYASTTSYTSAAADFFTSVAKAGASSAITVEDTYVTVCNLTGAGFLSSCISPSHSETFRPTIRITVDGVIYTLAPSADIAAAHRYVVGSFTPSTQIALDGASLYAGGYSDFGFSAASVGGVSYLHYYAGIPPTDRALAASLPVLRFSSSCKVEMKASLLSANAVHKQCAVVYRMDI